MARETKEFITKKGYKAILNTFITAREQRELNDLLYEIMDIRKKDDSVETNFKMNGVLSSKLEDLRIKLMIVSINCNIGDDKRTTLEKMLDMEAEDYNQIMAEISKVIDVGDKKKQS